MIVTWPVLAVTGIFFAAWMKPALPKAEWFQVCVVCVCVVVVMGDFINGEVIKMDFVLLTSVQN